MQLQPSASYSITLRIETAGVPGTLGRVTSAIGETGGIVGAIDLVSVGGGRNLRDITVSARNHGHEQLIVDRVSALAGINLLQVSNRTFLLHVGGKIQVTGRIPVKTSDDLSMVYTPGVARVCLAIQEDPLKQWGLTIKSHTIAVVSDGTAVLGLGDTPRFERPRHPLSQLGAALRADGGTPQREGAHGRRAGGHQGCRTGRQPARLGQRRVRHEQ